MQTLLKKRAVSSEELIALLTTRENGQIEFLLIDVREDMEYNAGHIKGVDMLKPTTSFQQWGQELFNATQDKTVIFTCRTGSRSGQMQNVFSQNGHKNVINHYGGIMSYRGDTER
jgi:rhodanese-related sulfurtransferase